MAIQPFKPVEISHAGFEEAKLRRLAREIAMGILDRDEILKLHGITEDDWQDIAVLPAFKTMLTDALAQWQSPLNTPERIVIKAQDMVEDALLAMFKFIHDQGEPANARVDAFKTIAKIARVDGEPKNGSVGIGGDKINIRINIGTQEVRVDGADPSPTLTLEGKAVEVTGGD